MDQKRSLTATTNLFLLAPTHATRHLSIVSPLLQDIRVLPLTTPILRSPFLQVVINHIRLKTKKGPERSGPFFVSILFTLYKSRSFTNNLSLLFQESLFQIVVILLISSTIPPNWYRPYKQLIYIRIYRKSIG